MLREPNFVLSERRVIVPVIQLSVEDRSIAGSRTVLVRSERRLRDVVVDDEEIDRVELAMRSPAADAWETYLESQGLDCARPDGDDGQRVVCESIDLERVQVIHFEIAVSFG